MTNDTHLALNKILATIAIVLACLLVLVSSYYFYISYTSRVSVADSDTALLNEAASRAQALDMNAASAMYAELVATETDPTKRARYAILQGFATNHAGQYDVGIPLLKAVAADQTVPSELKAEALIALLQLNFKPEATVPLRMIFNDGGIYAEAMADGSVDNIRDLRTAVNNLYETADSYHAYAVSEYARAFAAGQYVLNSTDLPADEKEERLAFIKNSIIAGDSLIDAELQAGLYKEDTTNVVRELLFTSMHMKLFALEVLARADESMRGEVDTYYKFLLEVFADTLNAPSVWSIENYARFYYAAYLAEVYGEERAVDIQTAMLPLYNASGDRALSNTYSIWIFFENALGAPEQYGVNASLITKVAEISNDFNVFLQAKGWVTN